MPATNRHELSGDFAKASCAARQACRSRPSAASSVETHTGTVTWQAPLEIAPGVEPRSLTVAGKITFQACAEDKCLPPKTVAFEAKPGPGAELPKSTAAAHSAELRPVRARAVQARATRTPSFRAGSSLGQSPPAARHGW